MSVALNRFGEPHQPNGRPYRSRLRIEQILVSDFVLRQVPRGSIWIGHASGEGMACDAAILEAALAAFWAEHF